MGEQKNSALHPVIVMSFHMRSLIPKEHPIDTLLNYWAHKCSCEYKTNGCLRPVHHLGESEMENTSCVRATYVQSTQQSNGY